MRIFGPWRVWMNFSLLLNSMLWSRSMKVETNR